MTNCGGHLGTGVLDTLLLVSLTYSLGKQLGVSSTWRGTPSWVFLMSACGSSLRQNSALGPQIGSQWLHAF